MTEANSTSPHAVMNAYTATATTPGTAAGSTTRSSVRTGPAPSTWAASSSPVGIESK